MVNLWEDNGGGLHLQRGNESWAISLNNAAAEGMFGGDAQAVMELEATSAEELADMLAEDGWLGVEVVPWDIDAGDPNAPKLVAEAGPDYAAGQWIVTPRHDYGRAAESYVDGPPRCDWCKEEVAPPGGMHTDCMKEMYVADMMQDRR